MLITSVTSRHSFSAWRSVECVSFSANRGINTKSEGAGGEEGSSVLIKQPRCRRKKKRGEKKKEKKSTLLFFSIEPKIVDAL